MLKTGSQILLRLADASRDQVLYIGGVVDVRGNVYTAEFEIEGFEATPGQVVVIFYHGKDGFLQQPARIDAVDTEPAMPTLSISLLGDPVSAESRQHERVSTVTTDLIATVAGEEFCPILDISETGFAVMASEAHALGAVVTVDVQFGNRRFSGTASVQSIKELWEGRCRYGFYCLCEDESHDLKSGLAEIGIALAPPVE